MDTDKSPYYDWYVGQRVFYYSPPSGSRKRWYGTVEGADVSKNLVILYIKFDDITGVMRYDNDYKLGHITIYPDLNQERLPDWEVQ